MVKLPNVKGCESPDFTVILWLTMWLACFGFGHGPDNDHRHGLGHNLQGQGHFAAISQVMANQQADVSY